MVFEEWKQVMGNKETAYGKLDIQGMELLAPFVAGFTTETISMFKGHIREAKSRKINDFQKFKQELQETTSQIFLYELFWIPSVPQYKELDEKTGEMVNIVDGPYITPGAWIVRYVEIKQE